LKNLDNIYKYLKIDVNPYFVPDLKRSPVSCIQHLYYLAIPLCSITNRCHDVKKYINKEK